MGNAGGSLHFGGDDEEEGEEDAVELPGEAEGSGVFIEDREEDVVMSVTGDHLAQAALSVSVLPIDEKARSPHVS